MTSPTVDALWVRIREVIGDQIVEIAAEVEAAESAATRAEHAAETAVTGVADGAVTRPKLAPEVVQELESKADLVGGKVPTSQIPEVALTKPFSVTSRAALLALDAQEGDIGIITAGVDKGSYMLGSAPANMFSSWVQLAVSADAPVSSVNGQTGTVVLNATDVGAASKAYVDLEAGKRVMKSGTATTLWSGTQAQYDALPTATRNAAGFIAVIV